MTKLRTLLLVGAASLLFMTGARAADHALTGAIASSSGEKLDGVTVYAKMEGSTVTTSVYTDESGSYYFPPLPAGKYRVWAQALGFETARSTVDLSGARRQNLVLQPMTDPERRIRQMPSEMLAVALPEATPDEARIKKIFMNNCTGCHPPSYMLQFRFDEAGWNKIIDLMKVVPNTGVYPGPGARANQIIARNQKELAAYLARARGPGETSMKFPPRPRPTGEAARVVWKIYDLPLNPDAGIGTKYNDNDGSIDWALGPPSKLGELPHDGAMGLDGNLYYTVNNPNRGVTIGKVDGRTGEVTYLKVDGRNGEAATAHGLTRDAQGNFWFDVNPGRRGLGKLDPKTGKITVYQTPAEMTPLGGAVTLDVDGKGKIWASAPEGAVRFDPVTETFTAFRSVTSKSPKGSVATYGAAGDRDGNGWWAQMALDTIGTANVRTGEVSEIKLSPITAEMERIKPEDREFYSNFNELTFGTPVPWSQGPRRMGTDKNADVLWVGNSWGASLTRIDTKTRETTIIPLPSPALLPYHIAVDSRHNAWGNSWTADQLFKYDPAAKRFTLFDLPVHGTETRHISLLERDGALHVVVPIYRSNQMGVMTPRSDRELAALRAQAR
ncbi:MAG: carboxypeptidase regulatory-like domain-containing protein [Acidobacteria bacterium]|nr:carboxypeptidase regulatory-like domain-containing protein [Acidobacteriota bacterium]